MKSELFTKALIPHGNGKLLDYDNPETGIAYRYAQFNTRPILDCPCRTSGCESVCYATKGNHMFPSVKESRERSYAESKRTDFAERITYTIRYHMNTKRFRNACMIIRIHESGDFYSVQYLRKWIEVWKAFRNEQEKINFVFYTKSFPFFLKLTEEEKEIIREGMKAGQIAMNLSIDDTTTPEQKIEYLKMLSAFPLANTYICTEDVESIEHDNVCDCADCAKCGTCNKAQGKKTGVKIHSASKADMDEYRKNIRSGK